MGSTLFSLSVLSVPNVSFSLSAELEKEPEKEEKLAFGYLVREPQGPPSSMPRPS